MFFEYNPINGTTGVLLGTSKLSELVTISYEVSFTIIDPLDDVVSGLIKYMMYSKEIKIGLKP